MCCGRLRRAAPVVARGVGPPAEVAFEYTGATALTVASPVTGKVYRFGAPGARVGVDARDRPWMSFVPNLVRRPV